MINDKTLQYDSLSMGECPMCGKIRNGDILIKGVTSSVVPCAFPRSRGHCLIIPHAHEENFFSLDQAVIDEIMQLLLIAKEQLHEVYNPSGWNVRINVGRIAGQTVGHVHVHLVPRYCEDPIFNPNLI